MERQNIVMPDSPIFACSLARPSAQESLEGPDLLPDTLLQPGLSWAKSSADFGAAMSHLRAEPQAPDRGDPQAPGVPVRRSFPAAAGRSRHQADYVPSPDLRRAFHLLASPAAPASPAWSLSFSPRRAPTHALVSRDPDHHLLPLRLAGKVETAAWSPDSRQLALSLRQDGGGRWPRLVQTPGPTWRGLLIDTETGYTRRLGEKQVNTARLHWSPTSDMLAMLEAPQGVDGGWHCLSVWWAGVVSEPPRMLLSARWQVPVDVTFSGAGRFLMLHVHDESLPVQRNIIDMHALPPPPTGTRVPPAEVVEWSSGDSLIFARDGSFARMGLVGRWSAESPLEVPYMLRTSGNYVRGLQVSQAGGRAAVLTQGATVGAGLDAQIQALLSTFEEPQDGGALPLRLGAQVWLHSPYVANDDYTMLMSWAPPGPYQDYLAVALPNSSSLWLIDSAERGATFELAQDLRQHRWMDWSLCGEYLLVSDMPELVERPVKSAQRPCPVPVAQLRIYRVGWRRPVLQECRRLSPGTAIQTSPAYAEASLARVTWLLPDSLETIDFVSLT